MAEEDVLQQTLTLMCQLLQQQQQQQQADRQMALEEKLVQQQAWVQRNLMELKMPKLTEDDDPEAFLKTFE